jgi:hypothetical protein
MKNMIIGLSILAMSCGLIQPATAANVNQLLEGTVLLPARTLGLATGIVVGSPIAVLRKSTENINAITNKITPDNHNVIPKVIAAGLVGIPFGIAAGAPEGVYLGSKNALVNCINKPFSVDSYSLGELN